MSRSETSPSSRERMLEATIALMRESGLSGAGINQIVRESGAPKGSVYYFFPLGKQQIVTEALAVYSQRVQEFIAAAMAGRGTSAERVRALFDAFAQRVEDGRFRRSCAVGAVSLDLDDDLDELRLTLCATFEEWRGLIEHHIELDDGRLTASFAGLVLTAIEGAYIRCRAEASSQPFREAGVWLARLVEGGGGPRQAPPAPSQS